MFVWTSSCQAIDIPFVWDFYLSFVFIFKGWKEKLEKIKK